jgi:hypothetical protein
MHFVQQTGFCEKEGEGRQREISSSKKPRERRRRWRRRSSFFVTASLLFEVGVGVLHYLCPLLCALHLSVF